MSETPEAIESESKGWFRNMNFILLAVLPAGMTECK